MGGGGGGVAPEMKLLLTSRVKIAAVNFKNKSLLLEMVSLPVRDLRFVFVGVCGFNLRFHRGQIILRSFYLDVLRRHYARTCGSLALSTIPSLGTFNN